MYFLIMHDRMYRAVTEHVDIDNTDDLTEYISDLVDADAFRFSLRQGIYRSKLDQYNVLAFEHSGVWAVPAYRLGNLKLDAVEDIGVSKERIRDLLKI